MHGKENADAILVDRDGQPWQRLPEIVWLIESLPARVVVAMLTGGLLGLALTFFAKLQRL